MLKYNLEKLTHTRWFVLGQLTSMLCFLLVVSLLYPAELYPLCVIYGPPADGLLGLWFSYLNVCAHSFCLTPPINIHVVEECWSSVQTNTAQCPDLLLCSNAFVFVQLFFVILCYDRVVHDTSIKKIINGKSVK